MFDIQERQGTTPKALENMPKLLPHLYWAYEQFVSLRRDRRYEQGTSLPLGNDQIKAYFDMFGLAVCATFEGFHEDMRKIDDVFLTVSSKDAESKKERTKSPATPPPNAPKRR